MIDRALGFRSVRSPAGSLPAFVAAGLALTALAWVADRLASQERLLHAATPAAAPDDSDGDGLHNVLELRLGLNPNTFDSDSDGYSDPEELARHSLGDDPSSIPGSKPVSVDLVVYQIGPQVQLVSVLYSADGDLASKPLGMGARVGLEVRLAPVSYFTKNAKISYSPGKLKGSAVSVIDAPLPPLLLERFGSLSFFTTIANEQGQKVSAGVANLALIQDVVVQYIPAGLSLAASSRPGQSTVPNSFYGPVDANAVLEWTPGEICGQTTVIAATMGPVVVQEVVAAGCDPGWDSLCDPGCAATVGTTIQTVDPVALLVSN